PAAAGTANASAYSPIWHVTRVVFRTGVTPQLLRSVPEIQQAASLGMVDVIPGNADNTFNCPVPFYYRPGTTTPITPIYPPPTNNTGTGGTAPYTPPATVPVNPTNPTNPTNPASTPGTY